MVESDCIPTDGDCLKNIAIEVIVTDYGLVRVNQKLLDAYGITSWPPNRRSKKQREAYGRLIKNLHAIHEHRWRLGESNLQDGI
jgi:hypothetical protein